MTNLNQLYTSTSVLFWMTALGLYGTGEGLGRLVTKTPILYRNVVHKLRSKTHDRDFYFAYRESGYIVMPGGNDFVNSRRERIVAAKHLEDIPISYLWSGEGTISEELFPDSLRIEELPRIIGQDRVRKRLRFAKALERGEELEYTLLIKCKQNGKAPEPYLSAKSAHRVDELLLRVVFPANLVPEQVVYVRRNPDGIETHRETIKERDRLTGEFRKLIKFAEPHVEHVIEWQHSPN